MSVPAKFFVHLRDHVVELSAPRFFSLSRSQVTEAIPPVLVQILMDVLCLPPLLVLRPRRGTRGLWLLFDRRIRHLAVGSGFIPVRKAKAPVPPPIEGAWK